MDQKPPGLLFRKFPGFKRMADSVSDGSGVYYGCFSAGYRQETPEGENNSFFLVSVSVYFPLNVRKGFISQIRIIYGHSAYSTGGIYDKLPPEKIRLQNLDFGFDNNFYCSGCIYIIYPDQGSFICPDTIS